MKNKFLQGTFILLVTSLLLRGLGFVYQMLVVRLVGTEAVGILNMSYPFYMMLVVLATVGMPVAIAKLTAEYVSRQREGQIGTMMTVAFRRVMVLVLCGLLGALFLLPRVFTLLDTEERVARCFYVLVPGIAIVTFTSLMRGYFQGMQQMLYPSLGQVAEQAIRVASGLVLLRWVCPPDVISLAMGLAAAAMIGELSGFLLLLIFYCRSRRKGKRKEKTRPGSGMLAKLLSLGLPTTFTRLTSTIDMAIEASLVPFCLLSMGYNASQAAGIYGQFSGVAMSLLTIPTVLTGALATALVPAISEADASYQKSALQRCCQQSIQITWAFSLPIILILYLYGDGLCRLLFRIDGLGPMIKMLSFGAVFMYLGQTIVGILQGLGQTRTVFFNNLWGSAAKLIGMYYCIRILGWGSNGIAGGMVLGYGLQCLCNLVALMGQVPIRMSWKEMLLPVAGSFLMLWVIQSCHWLLGNDYDVALLAALCAGGSVYVLWLFLTGQLQTMLGYSKKERERA